MKSEVIVQEPWFENYGRDESEEKRDVMTEKEFELKRYSKPGNLGELAQQTNRQAVLDSVITNYILHLR